MDDTELGTADTPRIDRRAFFGRALLATGAAVGLLGLTGCPGGGDGDDDDDDDGGDDD
ncbi:hypothetical protein [Phytohabitans houttuyneae]|uniref:Uncharacterized protein n=1 Tax=Phytohabitans houttuyneae TaxID=1076126 RepID=A0A6V8KLD9_9ACTN|nr:hypothetical protein [Phytohabitans houttuyneae]GFJ84240.1 hypothetical protein Phou_084200 [Phytohabitans houttuyneae]